MDITDVFVNWTIKRYKKDGQFKLSVQLEPSVQLKLSVQLEPSVKLRPMNTTEVSLRPLV